MAAGTPLCVCVCVARHPVAGICKAASGGLAWRQAPLLLQLRAHRAAVTGRTECPMAGGGGGGCSSAEVGHVTSDALLPTGAVVPWLR